jgi:serine/threonine-protein kinase
LILITLIAPEEAMEKQSAKSPTRQPAASPDLEQTTPVRPGAARKPAADLEATENLLLDPEATAPPTDSSDEVNHTDVPGGDEEIATQVESTSARATAGAAPKQKISSLGGFRLLKKLGEGGMGAVYKAQDVSLDRVVAVKVLAKHLAANKSFVDRFKREAKAMAKLDHPNIVRCYQSGDDQGLHYLAIEFVDGGSMEDWVKKLGKLSVADALHVIIACASALEHAYADHKMIHRDIKPDNILLTAKGIVKVADMGLAKSLSDDMSLTQTGTGAGTPVYMAPEQFKDAKHVDNRSDIYALGCMLYKFLTGKAPFEGETYVELFSAKEKGKYPPARKLNPDVPDRLDLIIDKTLSAKPDLRYKTCAELIKDLEGLGLAGDRLSFIAGSVGTTRPAAAPAPVPKTLVVGATVAPPAPKPSAKPAAMEIPDTVKMQHDYWYLKYEEDGRSVTRKLTEQQVIAMVKSPVFDQKTEASRSLKGGYRAIATYREFEPFLRGKISKERADRKTDKVQTLYKQIEKDYDRDQRRKGLRRFIQKLGNGVAMLIVLAIIAAVGFAVYWFVIRKMN